MNNKVFELVQILEVSNSREEAFTFIKENKFNVKELKEVANIKEIYLKTGAGKAVIVEKLVEGTIGARLCMRALLSK